MGVTLEPHLAAATPVEIAAGSSFMAYLNSGANR
jgi:hypothetical protein